LKVGILVNVMEPEKSGHTTIRLAHRLASSGHEVWVMSAGNFALQPDDAVRALARSARGLFRSSTDYLEALNGHDARQGWIDVGELDLLLLRFNPFSMKSWAEDAGFDFAREAQRRGVLVLNDPVGLSKASNKLYLSGFPEEVRPRTLITRNPARIEDFLAEQEDVVLKPLRGFGGNGVFHVTRHDRTNLEQILGSITRDGYAVAQEYLPAAAHGDTRLFLMDGAPLRSEGRTAVVHRVRTGDDLRSNVHVGGRIRRARMTETLERLAAAVSPKLRADGMFLVGLDVVGDKLLEINVFSPGGLGNVGRLEKTDFTAPVVAELERKVAARG